MLMYYVYAYFEPGNEKPFYIGKGSGQRAYQHTCRCRVSKQRTHFYNKLRSLLQTGIKPQIVLLQEGLTETEAFELETWLIRFFKRRCEGGCLCNHTTGGEGGAGYTRQTPVTKDERKRRSDAQKGKVFTKQHRQHISEARKGLKRSEKSRQKQRMAWEAWTPDIVACDPITGDIVYHFKGLRDAERAGFDRRAIHQVLKGTRQTHKGFEWSCV